MAGLQSYIVMMDYEQIREIPTKSVGLTQNHIAVGRVNCDGYAMARVTKKDAEIVLAADKLMDLKL